MNALASILSIEAFDGIPYIYVPLGQHKRQALVRGSPAIAVQGSAASATGGTVYGQYGASPIAQTTNKHVRHKLVKTRENVVRYIYTYHRCLLPSSCHHGQLPQVCEPTHDGQPYMCNSPYS